MEPFRETHVPEERRFPLKLVVRSSMAGPVFAHPHWHDEFEVLLILKGRGTQQTGACLIPFSSGDILPIPCGTVHSTETDADCENEILVLLFSREFIESGLLHIPEQRLVSVFFDGLAPPPVITPGTDTAGTLGQILRALACEWEERRFGCELLARAWLQAWVVHMTRFCMEARVSEGQPVVVFHEALPQTALQKQRDYRAKAMLRHTFDWLDTAYGDVLHVADAARSANLSVSQFERIFRAHTGQTFQRYLIRFRVQKACEQLDTGRTLTEIALACGFGSLASFTRAFRHVKGTPPSHLRKG